MGLGCLSRQDRHGSGAPLYKDEDQGSNSMQLLHETGPSLQVAWSGCSSYVVLEKAAIEVRVS